MFPKYTNIMLQKFTVTMGTSRDLEYTLMTLTHGFHICCYECPIRFCCQSYWLHMGTLPIWLYELCNPGSRLHVIKRGYDVTKYD